MQKINPWKNDSTRGSAPKKGRQRLAVHFEGEHFESGKVMVTDAFSNGNSFIRLWHTQAGGRKKQAMQITTTNFPDAHKVLAIRWMSDLGKTYSEQVVDKHEMEERKRDFMATLPYVPPGEGKAAPKAAPKQAPSRMVWKRPAAVIVNDDDCNDDGEG